MSWDINYTGAEPEKRAPSIEVNISDVFIDDIKPGNTRNRTDRGRLYPVNRASANKQYQRKYLRPFEVEMYEQLKKVFGVGALVAYADLKALFPHINTFALAYRFQFLWVNGYLDKFVKGYAGWKMIGEYPKGKGLPRGKYFGVHYRILDKKVL